MQTVDEEPLETIHLYAVREEAARPSLWPVFLALLALSTPLALCTLSPSQQPEERLAIRIPAVFLPLGVFTASVQIIPTGVKEFPASPARGELTIYNGSILTQELPSGFIVTSENGVEVATDSPVTIPPANPPSYGIATVPSHALQLGKVGNIAAYEVNAVYGADIYIKNLTAFRDGRDVKVVKVVTNQDTHLALTNARSILISQTNRYPGMLAYPCKERLVQKTLLLMASWGCQFVTFIPPPGAKVLSARLSGRTVVLQIMMTLAPRKAWPGK